MDESEYRELYHSVNSLRCVFEKAMLTRRFNCENLVKINIAEREAAGCNHAESQSQCQHLLGLFRMNAAFALKISHASTGPLPHAKEIKVQCGGLLGLQACLHEDRENDTSVNNVHGLIREAMQIYHDLEHFPYAEVAKGVSRFEGRKRKHRRS